VRPYPDDVGCMFMCVGESVCRRGSMCNRGGRECVCVCGLDRWREKARGKEGEGEVNGYFVFSGCLNQEI
jgi:hypothetical protein